MGKQIPINLNTFSGGISDSSRVQNATQFQRASHFDCFSDPNRLIPYRSLEVDDTDVKTYFVRDFKYGANKGTTTNAEIYGLGQNGSGNTKIVYKTSSIANGWTVPVSSEGNGAVKNGCFVEFQNYMWGFQGTNQIFKWGLLSGTPSITNSVATVGATITSVADGVINSLGDMYMAYNNILVRVSPAGAVTDNAKTVPTNYKITSLANWGNYLAIGCSPVSNFNGVSKVFIWDYASTDKFVDVIDWGEGELRVLETVEGYLVGITDRYLNNDVGASKGSMIVQIYAGGVPSIIKEVFTQKLNGKSIPTSKALRNNRLFWSAKIMTNAAGTEYAEGLWSFGRKNSQYPWALNLDIISSTVNTNGIQGFGVAGNFFYVACNNDGTILKTHDTATYTETSSYETQVLNFGDADTDKKLDSFKVSFAPMTSGHSISAYIKVDDDSSWTLIGTTATVGLTSYTFKGLPSDVNFPSGKEFLFKVTSTGGAEITGWTAKAQILNTL